MTADLFDEDVLAAVRAATADSENGWAPTTAISARFGVPVRMMAPRLSGAVRRGLLEKRPGGGLLTEWREAA